VEAVERRTPRYLRIYRDLKAQIAGGALEPGARLPTQRDLATGYGVTLMTARHALRLLEQEELVVMRHGRGTFVASARVRYATGALRSLAQEMAAQGLDLRTRVLRLELAVPHPRVAELLRLEPGDAVFSIERLRLIGADPVVLQHSELPRSLGEALAEVDLAGVSLYDHLERELGIEVGHARESIHAVNLAAAEASLLGEEPGAAAILSERVTFSAAGEPIMFDRASMRGDRVSIAADRLTSGVSVGYELRLDEEGA
jgi:GntR family transcriptional regulator